MSLEDVTPKSVRRKLKDKNFAKDVSRDDIQKGADELGIDLDEHITFIVESMNPISEQIGLAPSV
jgi:predicted hydrolase (HD superfamily)